MLSKNKFIEEKLKSFIIINENEELQRTYDWIKDYNHINFWQFLSVNYLEIDRFFTMLDIETGPHSGWEKFVEALGLTLWEDRKWCSQYHNGSGPTKVALSKLLEKNDYDRDLSLSFVLEILKEMERFDILLQIDWQLLTEKYSKFEHFKSNVCKETEEPLIFQLNRSYESSQLVKSEPVPLSDEISRREELLMSPNKITKGSKLKVSAVCILMTYAPDTEEWAKNVANALREQVIRRKQIRVIMIGDTDIKRALAMDCNNTLHKWFHQVQYVVPVLSPQYLKQIQNLDNMGNKREVAKYNRLIYRFLLDQFASFGSRNLRCRPICPNSFFSEVQESSVVRGNGLFSIMWECDTLNQIKEFGLVLMDKPLQE